LLAEEKNCHLVPDNRSLYQDVERDVSKSTRAGTPPRAVVVLSERPPDGGLRSRCQLPAVARVFDGMETIYVVIIVLAALANGYAATLNFLGA